MSRKYLTGSESKPTLTTVAKLSNRGSGLLKLADVDLKNLPHGMFTLLMELKDRGEKPRAAK